MAYIDGVVVAVPIANKEKYIDEAKNLGALFTELGALDVVDGWGDDVPEGEVTSFSMSVNRQDGETVVFSWITWPDKDTRDAAWAKAMEDPRMTEFPQDLFDGKRMIFGGFDMIHRTSKGA